MLSPINTTNDQSFKFIDNFSNWLLHQKPLGTKFLTKQTYDACCVTTYGFVKCCYHLLEGGHYGILPGVFQSDPLEKRFGLYRLTQGSNYHINVKSLIQSEKT